MKMSLLFSSLVSLSLCIPAVAADTWGQESLNGFQGPVQVGLSMTYCAALNAVFSFGLDGSEPVNLRRDLEMRLRVARIPVAEKAGPLLFLNIHCLPVNVGSQLLGYAVHMELNFQQYVLIPATKRDALAATWESVDDQLCTKASCAAAIQRMAKDMGDAFVTDVFKANEAK